MSKKSWSPPQPTPGSTCVYIGGIGPFYSDPGLPSLIRAPKMEEPRNTQRDTTTTDTESDTDSLRQKVKRNVTFSNNTFDQPSFLSAGTSRLDDVTEESSMVTDSHDDAPSASMLDHPVEIRKRYKPPKPALTVPTKKQIYKRRWTIGAISALFVSCVLCNVALVTKSWGHLKVVAVETDRDLCGADCNERTWYFGLWQTCRDDGICLGTRWPPLYGLVRCTAVLALFIQSMTLAWSLGHNIERLLVFDPCIMFALGCLCFIGGVLSTFAVCFFTKVWPVEFYDLFTITSHSFGFSFYLQVASIPCSALAGVCTVLDFILTWKTLKSRVPRGRLSMIKRYPPSYNV